MVSKQRTSSVTQYVVKNSLMAMHAQGYVAPAMSLKNTGSANLPATKTWHAVINAQQYVTKARSAHMQGDLCSFMFSHSDQQKM